MVGDGEAETGPLATAWHSNKFLDPVGDGAALPILHLNGYKIANPTVLARITRDELDPFLRGCGWTPIFVQGHEPEPMHALMAAALDRAVLEIGRIRRQARQHGQTGRPRGPMTVLDSPKGWTGPKVVDGQPIEGKVRSHQVPLHPADHPGHLQLLEDWLRSYRKRSANPSTHPMLKLRTLRPLQRAVGRGDHGSRTAGAVFGAGAGLSGLWPEGQGMGPGQWGVAVGVAELVRTRRALAGAAGRC